MNESAKNYNKTKIACYLGFITQAIVANFTPLLFTAFHREYGIPLANLALIPAVFYIIQLITDFLCAKFKNIDYRRSIVISEIAAAIGLVGLAFIPSLFSNPMIGILICVCIYAVGSGLIEVLCSPIIEACPFPNKESTMSLLHSFYCWGAVGVILGSTLFFTFFGVDNWKILACVWALIPLYNIINFTTCPIEPIVEDANGMNMGQLLKKTNVLDIPSFDGCCRSIRMHNGTVGIGICGSVIRSRQSYWRLGRTMWICILHGAWPTLVWQERSESRPYFLHDRSWNSMFRRLPDSILIPNSTY